MQYQQVPPSGQQQQQQGYQQQQQGYQPGYGQPQVYMGDPNQMIQVEINTGLAALHALPAIYIKQKFDWIEIGGFCEKQNTYFVYPADNQGNIPDFTKGMPLFKCKEKSSCFQRQCLPAACRAFEIKIKQFTMNQHQKQDDDKFLVMKLSRPFKCTCLCLNRPELEVYQTSARTGASEPLGKILFPCLVCDVGVVVMDMKDKVIFNIKGSCCQLGFWMKCPCKACQTIKFLIMDDKEQVLSELWKESAGCMKSCAGDADYFRLIFPPNATKEQKCLLLAAALFIDYNYFEVSPADERQNQES